MKSPFLYYLVLPVLLFALPARADFNYGSEPLYLNKGVQPNVALLVDNSGSMQTNDAGSVYPFVNACTGGTVTGTGPISRMEAAKQAACQVVQDNANGMRIALYKFIGNTSGTGIQVVNFGSTIPTLKSAINGINDDQYTPLGSSMHVMLTNFLGSNGPIQYRCQKNYVVFFTDGKPSAGIDYDGNTPNYPTYPATSTAQLSDWPNSTSQAGAGSLSPGWDGYPDPTYTGEIDRILRPWLDDLAQFGYDVDMKTSSSAATPAAVCGGTASVAGQDCTGVSWDAPDFPKQNVVTYTIGLGMEANNTLLRDTPLVNRYTIASADVDIAANTINWPDHGLSHGDFVHYYAQYESNDYSTAATANTGTEFLTGNTLNMATADALSYDNGGGANLQYQVITTPAVPAAICGAIGGLTSGNNYYVDGDTVDRFYLSTSSSNAYAGTQINLTSTGTANTVHTFTRTHATAGFTTTNSGTTPVNISANIEKITRIAHGLNTGDLVTYTCTGTSCVIGGLASGNTYYVARRSADEFRLATSALLADNCAAANDGNATVGTSCINLTGRGSAGGVQMFHKVAPEAVVTFSAMGSGTVPVNTSTDTLTSAAHGFNVGDRVTYTCSNFAGTPAIYTSYNLPATVYARDVVAGNPGTFRLALTAGGAALDISNAGTAAQSLFWTKPVAQPAIGGLYPYVTDATPDATPAPASEDAAKGKYYVTVIDGDTIQLYDAIRYGRSPLDVIRATFSGTYASISSTNRKITLGHDFVTGDAVVYTCPNGCTGGLTNGTTYYVGVVSASEIRLASTLANAAGCATSYTGCIAFTSTDVDVQYLTYTPPAGSAVDFTSAGSGVLSTGPGKSRFAITAEELTAAMQEVFNDIRLDSSGRKSEWVTSASVLNNAQVYNTRFNDRNWSGDVQANPLHSETGIHTEPPIWKASEQLPAYSARNIVTRSDTYGARAFTTTNWSSLTANQQTALSNGGGSVVGQDILNWIRGQEVSGYRARAHGVLGDFLGSVPTHIAVSDKKYENTLPPGAEQFSYAAFKTGQSSRMPMIYAGANDGMLHGFNANTGTELFAFIPEAVYMDWNDLDNDGVKDAGEAAINKFYQLSQTNYGQDVALPHQYFVDGSPIVGDAYFGGSWHTVLVGGLGKGGRSVYALDVTDPSAFGTSKVLWEFDDNNSGDMGYSYSQPQIARLQNGTWVAIFGNGYDSAGDMARLFIVNLQTGALIRQIDAGPAGNNGLSSVTVRNDATDTAIAVYAGDLQGNVWKFDISNVTPANWTATAFFTAMDSSGNRQAIMAGITLGEHFLGGVMLYVGTGTYFRAEDRYYNGTPVYDALYGLWDNDAGNISPGDLVEQSLQNWFVEGIPYRVATANMLDYGGIPANRGWFMKVAADAVYRGEKVVSQATLGDTGLVFTTIIPAINDPCVNNGDGMTLVVDPLSGGQLANAVIDTNDDDVIDANDVPVAGFENNGNFLVIQDSDGVTVDVDNCPFTDNSDQLNTDNDSLGNACDSYPSNPAVSSDNDSDGAPEAWDVMCDANCQAGSGLSLDNCPFNNNADQLDTDSDTQGDACDSDDDNDGVADTLDKFPLNIAASLDSDNDGYANSWNVSCDVSCQTSSGLTLDNCPATSNNTQANFDGDSQGDACDSDDDNDGVPDSSDAFDLDPAETVDTDNDGVGNNADTDDDGDTIDDVADNCSLAINVDQLNTDGDSQGDMCDTDDDNDGVVDGSDKFPLNAAASSDTDNDAYPDSWDAACDVTCQQASGLVLDNCPSNANPDQLNTDGDAQGDICDTDDDNDGVLDSVDNCPLVANANQLNTDGDGRGDVCDVDALHAEVISKIAAGSFHNCTITSVGAIRCWGSNDSGQLGDNSTILLRRTPVDVVGLSGDVTALSAGYRHSCAITSVGAVQCWGSNGAGQLGDNSTTQHLTPVDVAGLNSGVTAMAAGQFHNCAVTSVGGVKCWGSNDYGQLGDNSTTQRLTPVDVVGLGSGVTALAAGSNHTCALTSVGAVKCWGRNDYGQLGDSSTTQRLTPADVFGLSGGVTALTAGDHHSCAITSAEALKCWGWNNNRQLGNNSISSSSRPVDVLGLSSGVTAMAAGQSHSCAATSVGGVKCWGYNYYGQLGDNSTTQGQTPVDVVGLGSGVTALAAGSYHTCALTDAGAVKCWGRNFYGELGDNSSTQSLVPVGVSGLSGDSDGDGIGELKDNCPSNVNANQLNTDGDAAGDVCDTDDDNDGIQDIFDIFPLDPTESADVDNDGAGDNADLDDDNDGMPDAWENTYGFNPMANDAAGDFDGDGLGNFQEYTNNTNPILSNGSGDVSGDGFADILWRNEITKEMRSWTMNGNNLYAAISFFPQFSLGNDSWRVVALADVNHDGFVDVVFRDVINGYNRAWLMRTENGSVNRNAIVFYPQFGNADWSVDAGDMNGDGTEDLLFHNIVDGKVRVWTMDNTGNRENVCFFLPQLAGYQVQAIDDFDGDNDADIFWRNPVTGSNQVWRMSACAVAEVIPLPEVVGNTLSVAGAGDFNNDETDDLLWINSADSSQRIWSMLDGNRNTDNSIPAIVSGDMFSGVADYNGDGTDDILYYNSVDGYPRIWWMESLTRASSIRPPKFGEGGSWSIINDQDN